MLCIVFPRRYFCRYLNWFESNFGFQGFKWKIIHYVIIYAKITWCLLTMFLNFKEISFFAFFFSKWEPVWPHGARLKGLIFMHGVRNNLPSSLMTFSISKSSSNEQMVCILLFNLVAILVEAIPRATRIPKNNYSVIGKRTYLDIG